LFIREIFRIFASDFKKNNDMGTNFYARVIPTHERKEELKNLIDEGDFGKIREEIFKTYDSFHPYDMDEPITGIIHLGKRSGGWKFLWNPNIYRIRCGHTECIDNGNGSKTYKFIPEPDKAYYLYPLTKEGIKNFIDQDFIEVYDEYGEKQDKDEFFKEAVEWTKWKDWTTGEEIEAYDSASYEKEHPGESHLCLDNDYTRLLTKEGFEFTSKTHSDFYSDGLRFSTSVEFC
jgi:hypothetical protein